MTETEQYDGKWQVVGKNNKQKALTSNQRRALIENMPKLKSNDPIKDTSTMFDAFIKKRENDENAVIPSQVPSIDTQKPLTNSVPNKKPVKDKNKKLVKPASSIPVFKANTKLTFEEAVKKIHLHTLESTLNDSKEHFPNSPEVWMKDVASVLNLHMEPVPDPDPAYRGKGPGYPLNTLNEETRAFLLDLTASCSNDTLCYIYSYCIQVIVSEINKGQSCHGYRMFLQSVTLQAPSIKINQFVEMAKSDHQKPLQSLAILWAIGQCGIHNMERGLKLWFDAMSQFLTLKHTASYAVLYLEHILKGNLSQAYGIVTIRDFFPIFDLIFSNTPTISTDLKIRLSNIYPKLKQIAVKEPAKTLHLFFPSLLTRAVPSCNGALKAELVSWMMKCLGQDPQTFSVWRQMYTKNLTQSGVLLGHIHQMWPGVKKHLGEKVLMTTLQSFNVTNDDLMAKGNKQPEKTGCVRLCKNMLKKTEPPKMSWFWILPLISGFVAVIIAYDVYTAQSFHSSRSLRFMEEYGILAFVHRVYSFMHDYTFWTASWLMMNVPVYVMVAYNTALPYIQYTIDAVIQFAIYLIEVTTPHRTWLVDATNKTYISVYNWSPSFWSRLPSLWWSCIDQLHIHLTLLWQYTIGKAEAVSMWLDTILKGEPGSIGEYLHQVKSSLHTHLQTTYEWCRTVINSWK